MSAIATAFELLHRGAERHTWALAARVAQDEGESEEARETALEVTRLLVRVGTSRARALQLAKQISASPPVPDPKEKRA